MRISDADAARLRELREAIRALAIANQGGPPEAAVPEIIRRHSGGAQLTVAVEDTGRTALEAARGGGDGAVATLLGILHEAQLSGDWSRLKGCRQVLYNVPANVGLDFDLSGISSGIYGFLLVLVMLPRPGGLLPASRALYSSKPP